MITENLVMKIQNHVMNHGSEPVKLDPAWCYLASILPDTLIEFNNPERYKNKSGNICSENIFELVTIVTNLLEKSFTSRKSFDWLWQRFDYLIESCIKYADYLESNLQAVAEHQVLEEAEVPVELMKLPFLEGIISDIYNTTREKVFMEKIIGKLEWHSFYEEIEVLQFLPELKAHKYHLLKKFTNRPACQKCHTLLQTVLTCC